MIYLVSKLDINIIDNFSPAKEEVKDSCQKLSIV